MTLIIGNNMIVIVIAGMLVPRIFLKQTVDKMYVFE
jgi:hypothetical protein